MGSGRGAPFGNRAERGEDRRQVAPPQPDGEPAAKAAERGRQRELAAPQTCIEVHHRDEDGQQCDEEKELDREAAQHATPEVDVRLGAAGHLRRSVERDDERLGRTAELAERSADVAEVDVGRRACGGREPAES